jgi:THO complex subunit 4
MQTQQHGRNTTRNFHGQKKQLLKQQAGNAPPAWKGQQQQLKANAKGGNARKSRILLSELPKDVLPEEVVVSVLVSSRWWWIYQKRIALWRILSMLPYSPACLQHRVYWQVSQALFSKTVGPVKEEDTFIVYNNKGDSRGMAIVTFQREADAYAARTKYNGKLIDGRTYVGPFIRIQWYR